MNDIQNIMSELNLDQAKIQELAAAVQGNPFAALGKIQELGISMETVQKLLKMVMANPAAFMEMAQQAGIPDETLSGVKDQIKRFT